MEKHSIEYGNQIIEFIIERKNVKNVNLNIKPNMTIMVSASEKVPIDFIREYVKKKGAWITKQVKSFINVQPYNQSEREYASGESFKYLGKQYRLRVLETTDDEGVKYFRGFIILSVKDTDNYAQKSKLMDEWYRDKTRIVFERLLDRLYPVVQKYGVLRPLIDFRTMKARWGSALLDSNTILLNSELIKAPSHCIEYVILHELIHFKYNDHSEKFYEMLYSLMPDWEKRKEILDEEVVREL